MSAELILSPAEALTADTTVKAMAAVDVINLCFMDGVDVIVLSLDDNKKPCRFWATR